MNGEVVWGFKDIVGLSLSNTTHQFQYFAGLFPGFPAPQFMGIIGRDGVIRSGNAITEGPGEVIINGRSSTEAGYPTCPPGWGL